MSSHGKAGLYPFRSFILFLFLWDETFFTKNGRLMTMNEPLHQPDCFFLLYFNHPRRTIANCCAGGKKKPLKAPKKESKELDEVSQVSYLSLPS